jgi:Zn-dependent protease/CBS domain-containing protein
MRNFEVGRITGIPIRLNITLVVFLPLLAWLISRDAQLVFYADVVNEIAPQAIDIAAIQSGTTSEIVGVGTAIGLFVGVLLHELGHSWVARRYGISIASITLWIFGGMARMEELPEDWSVELYVALAGPAMSVLVGGVCYGLLFVLPAQPILVFVIGSLAVINVALAIFNLIPAFPMDGGRVLRALLARSRPYTEATQTAATVGKLMAILMAAFALIAFAPLLLLIAMFVYVAAGAESRTTVLRDVLGGMTVRDLMSTDVRTITPETTVSEFLDRVLTERTTAYPVMERGTVLGVVTLESVRKLSAEQRDSTAVTAVMGAMPPTVEPGADAFEALAAMSNANGDRILVVEEGRFIGQVTTSDFMTAIEVLQGLGPHRDIELSDGYA